MEEWEISTQTPPSNILNIIFYSLTAFVRKTIWIYEKYLYMSTVNIVNFFPINSRENFPCEIYCLGTRVIIAVISHRSSCSTVNC